MVASPYKQEKGGLFIGPPARGSCSLLASCPYIKKQNNQLISEMHVTKSRNLLPNWLHPKFPLRLLIQK